MTIQTRFSDFLYFFSPPRYTRHYFQIRSMANMLVISRAIMAYEAEHAGEAPEHLSELVPQYIDTQHLYGGSKYMAVYRSEHRTDETFVALFSPYDFRVLPDQKVLVYERTPLWGDGKVGYFLNDPNVADGPAKPSVFDFDRDRLTPDEFSRRYQVGFRP